MEKDVHYIGIVGLVFVPYRGFFFLNMENNYKELNNLLFSSPIGAFIFLICFWTSYQNALQLFSSPIGAFIFLIKDVQCNERNWLFVFVPYRGFYFLNIKSNDGYVEILN